MSDELFSDVNRTERQLDDAADEAAPRYETANRTQVELTPTDLESLLPPGHAARLVWRFVEGLDLQPFYAAIRAREGRAGRPAIDPKILVALWLYATIDGVGSAREVDRLCYAHDAYRWLRGGVSVNYHTLSDFRVGHQAALDRLLTQSITVLLGQARRDVESADAGRDEGARQRGRPVVPPRGAAGGVPPDGAAAGGPHAGADGRGAARAACGRAGPGGGGATGAGRGGVGAAAGGGGGEETERDQERGAHLDHRP